LQGDYSGRPDKSLPCLFLKERKMPRIILKHTKKQEREIMDTIRLKETKRRILKIQATKKLSNFEALLALLHEKGVL